MSTHVLQAGTHCRGIIVDDRERSYLVHVPDGQPPSHGWPIVLAFHGAGTNAKMMEDFSQLSRKSDEAKFVAAYPNGSGITAESLTFNGGQCCGHAMREGIDDVAFTNAILDDLSTSLSCDERSVFATGMSNGALMCYELASKLAHRIAAIAPVGGPMGSETCSPSHPVSVCHFHGTHDMFAPYGGGRGRRSITKTNFYSVEHTIRTWVQANDCEEEPTTTTLPTLADDQTTVRRDVYANGRDGSEVILYTIVEGGHTWPGVETTLWILGRTTKNVHANDVMWEFFQRHRR